MTSPTWYTTLVRICRDRLGKNTSTSLILTFPPRVVLQSQHPPLQVLPKISYFSQFPAVVAHAHAGRRESNITTTAVGNGQCVRWAAPRSASASWSNYIEHACSLVHLPSHHTSATEKTRLGTTCSVWLLPYRWRVHTGVTAAAREAPG